MLIIFRQFWLLFNARMDTLRLHSAILPTTNRTTEESHCTRASVQNVASVQDQDQDVDFGRLQTLLRQTVLQVGAEGGAEGKHRAGLVETKAHAGRQRGELEQETGRQKNHMHGKIL